ncbi:MAG: hypothetical protein BWY76_02903 [bacterium ADurb.Bin429]|nr:MAG: hypothetical protein BWY76_02903 [bacterium ADurb.Bin429]
MTERHANRRRTVRGHRRGDAFAEDPAQAVIFDSLGERDGELHRHFGRLAGRRINRAHRRHRPQCADSEIRRRDGWQRIALPHAPAACIRLHASIGVLLLFGEGVNALHGGDGLVSINPFGIGDGIRQAGNPALRHAVQPHLRAHHRLAGVVHHFTGERGGRADFNALRCGRRRRGETEAWVVTPQYLAVHRGVGDHPRLRAPAHRRHTVPTAAQRLGGHAAQREDALRVGRSNKFLAGVSRPVNIHGNRPRKGADKDGGVRYRLLGGGIHHLAGLRVGRRQLEHVLIGLFPAARREGRHASQLRTGRRGRSAVAGRGGFRSHQLAECQRAARHVHHHIAV